MILPPTDLHAITGYKRPADQIRWLRAAGWVFEVGGDGKPKVSRAYAERRLGGVKSKADGYVPPFLRAQT